MPENSKLKFQPRARIIRTIGDQLISGPEAAIIELVKNSYDADASKVEITFFPPLDAGAGRISVSDDGHGMSLDDIRLKWMEPATSSKTHQKLSPERKRTLMGSKGIGRFAAAKLGKIMSLTSTVSSKNSGKSILIPELDWTIFGEDTYLADIEIDYLEQVSNDPSGTTIEILELNQTWTKARIETLYTELRRLLSPFLREEENDFSIFLDLSHCTQETCGFDGASIVNSHYDHLGDEDIKDAEPHRVFPFPLLTACDYELEGTFTTSGSFKGVYRNRRAGRGDEIAELTLEMNDDEESPGEFGVHLFIFDREASAIRGNMEAAGMGHLSAAEARRLLDSIAGIAIYREGFRIRPYGDPENDWLALDTRRVQDPSLRIGHNQVAGYINIDPQRGSNLVERSSREGLEENAAFGRLAKLVKALLTKIVEPRRFKFRSDTGLARKRSTTFDEVRQISELKQIRSFVSKLSGEDREKAEKIIDKESRRLQDRIAQLQERQRVLEAQSALGSIIAEVLHEGGNSVGFIVRNSERLQKFLPALLNPRNAGIDDAPKLFRERLPLIAESGEALANLFARLQPLASGRRGKPKFFRAHDLVRNAALLFEVHKIPIDIESDTPKLELIGYPGDLTTALVNLIGNAIHWLEDAKREDPRIQIVITRKGNSAHIYVEDNGPGVPEEFAESIFDVGFSLKEGGTGLGLNIAREALARSGGNLLFHLDHEDGALFEIIFPAREDES